MLKWTCTDKGVSWSKADDESPRMPLADTFLSVGKQAISSSAARSSCPSNPSRARLYGALMERPLEHEVRPGPLQDGQWFVTDGLRAGDRGIIGGSQKFGPGDNVASMGRRNRSNG